jgi:type II secretory pathway predicted ATPase ExeA
MNRLQFARESHFTHGTERMYESFFGFAKRPFLAVSTLDRYFPATSIEQTFQTASRAIGRGEGPIAIFGGTGLGKTMCCLRIAENFRRNFEVVMLASSQLITRRALLQSLLFELRMPYREMSEGELRLTLMNRLQPSTENPSDGLVLIVDEAQTLSIKLLEELRLLTNVVRNGVPRVRLVLCGTMRLEESLSNPLMESMSQRLAARCYLTPLSLQETGHYVKHKIELSGVDFSSAMTRDALDAIYRGSDGIPRLIDQLADQALMLACNDRERPVSAAMVGRAWCMLQQLPNPWSEPESIAKSTIPESTFDVRSNASETSMFSSLNMGSSGANSFGLATPVYADLQSFAQPSTPLSVKSEPARPATSPSMPAPTMFELPAPAAPKVVAMPTPVAPTRVNDAATNRSTVEFGQLDDDLPMDSMSNSSSSSPSSKKNLLDVFAGDFDEEFSIPVQSSGSYQAYSGAAYGNLNYDLSSFGTKPAEEAKESRFQFEEANDFLNFATSQPSPAFAHEDFARFDDRLVQPNFDEPVSNISAEQAANLERQIEDEMRELVSGLNLSAMTFDPTTPIEAFPNFPVFTFEAVRESDSVEVQRMAHQAHSDVISFSGLGDSEESAHHREMTENRLEERAAMSDDRDLLVIEDELEAVRNGAQQAVTGSSRAVLHPYAKLFTKLRNS